MCSENLKGWSMWLPLANWWYNTNFHTSTQITPYEVVYNQPPLLHLPYFRGETFEVAVDKSMQKSESMIHMLKFFLKKAKDGMKSQAKLRRLGISFDIGSWFWIKLHPDRQ